MSRAVPLVVALAASVLAAVAPVASAAQVAPGAPGAKHTWAPADKHGFGTATSLRSPVWFTLRAAELTEAYYPDLGTPSLRDLVFAVTDGRTFLDRETDRDVRARVEALPGLRYRQTTETSRWRITKSWVTDTRRATVLADVRFESRTGRALRLHLLADPAPGDDGNDDRGRTHRGGLLAYDDRVASYITTRPGLAGASSGYAGRPSDPRQDLRRDFDLDGRFEARRRGNVVQAAATRLTGLRGADRLTLAIGFGPTPADARGVARDSLAKRFTARSDAYARGWSDYLAGLKAPPASVTGDPALRAVYDQSLLVLAASEDKRHRGASVASPSMPWVWGTLTLAKTEDSGPYHLIWPRDLYHVITAQQIAGDTAAAGRMLHYLWQTQRPDGAWWQNTEVDGRKNWEEVQFDQVALPVVAAWWLGRTGAEDWRHVRAAADFLVRRGPRTDQERWENQSGWSPNTIATQVAGLVCAAEIARANGDGARADRYLRKADAWAAKVQRWTATTNGPHSDQPYYVRVTKDGRPDDGSDYELGDNFPRKVDEREVVDQSFLGLVLFGVKPHEDPVIRNSLAVGDRLLRADTANGPIWRRFTHDGYGETRTGAMWEIFERARRQTLGRAWPLLTGERGEYELMAGGDARPHLATIAATANGGLMLPEQVWDGRAPTGRAGHASGEGTRAATPLAWTHAQFVRLAWSIDTGRPVETPSVVACRYTRRLC